MIELLYHGTRQLDTILTQDQLLTAPIGTPCVSLTSHKSVAEYFSELERDETNGVGILALDAKRIREDYPTNTHQDVNAVIDEHETQVWKDIKPLSKYLVSVERL